MIELTSDRLQALQNLALTLAAAAAESILPQFRVGAEVYDKASAGAVFDPVTAADRGAEAAIRALLDRHAPDHGVIGEEYGDDRADAEFVWVLDPIDGTRAFIAGLPTWTTLIALRHQGLPVVGLIAQPYLDEIYVGDVHGSKLIARGVTRALNVRPCASLAAAVLSTTDPYLFTAEEAPAWERVRRGARLIRYGCDGYAFARVAAGDLDLVVESGLKAWDIDAAIPLIAGAGGLCTDWRGAAIGQSGGRVAAAGDRACLEEALRVLTPPV